MNRFPKTPSHLSRLWIRLRKTIIKLLLGRNLIKSWWISAIALNLLRQKFKEKLSYSLEKQGLDFKVISKCKRCLGISKIKASWQKLEKEGEHMREGVQTSWGNRLITRIVSTAKSHMSITLNTITAAILGLSCHRKFRCSNNKIS